MKRVVRSIGLLAVFAAPLLAPAEASAQRYGHARAVARPAVYAPARPYYNHYRPYYRPYYGPGWGWGFGISFGYGGWYGYPSFYGAYGYPFPAYGYYGYPFPYAYPVYYDSSARLQVQPRHAEVFVDGHFVGYVDNFDGWAQRLNVAPGEHQLTVYLKGHQTFRQNVLFRPGATLNVKHVMQPLAAGEQDEPRPVPVDRRASRPAAGEEYTDEGVERDPGQRPGDPVPSPRRGAPEAPGLTVSRDYGSLAMRVQPMDAEVIVDGEAWQSPQAGSITLQLSDGTHRVEVRKDGYRTYSADVRVRRGESTALNVSLSRD